METKETGRVCPARNRKCEESEKNIGGFCGCTLPKGHVGDHEAGGFGGVVFCRWPQETESTQAQGGGVSQCPQRVETNRQILYCIKEAGHAGMHRVCLDLAQPEPPLLVLDKRGPYPPLRERLVCAALQGILARGDTDCTEEDQARWARRLADKTLAEMEKNRG